MVILKSFIEAIVLCGYYVIYTSYLQIKYLIYIWDNEKFHKNHKNLTFVNHKNKFCDWINKKSKSNYVTICFNGFVFGEWKLELVYSYKDWNKILGSDLNFDCNYFFSFHFIILQIRNRNQNLDEKHFCIFI